MKRRSWVVAAAAMALVFASALYAQRPQRQGGPPGGGDGGRGMMGFVERTITGSWVFVSLELDTSDDQLIQLRKVYREHLKTTREKVQALADLPQEERQNAMQELFGIQRELREAVRSILTEEQNAKLDEWAQQQMRQMQRQMPQRQGEGGSSRRPGGS